MKKTLCIILLSVIIVGCISAIFFVPWEKINQVTMPANHLISTDQNVGEIWSKGIHDLRVENGITITCDFYDDTSNLFYDDAQYFKVEDQEAADEICSVLSIIDNQAVRRLNEDQNKETFDEIIMEYSFSVYVGKEYFEKIHLNIYETKCDRILNVSVGHPTSFPSPWSSSAYMIEGMSYFKLGSESDEIFNKLKEITDRYREK